jgi:uncharacterized protein
MMTMPQRRQLLRCASSIPIPSQSFNYRQQQSLRHRCRAENKYSTRFDRFNCTVTSSSAALVSLCSSSSTSGCIESSAAAVTSAPASSYSKIFHGEHFYPYSGSCILHHQHHPNTNFSTNVFDRSRRYNSSSSSSSGDDEISGIRGGADLLSSASSSSGTHRKIILESYAPSGIDVNGLICVGGENNNNSNSKSENEEYGDLPGMSKIIHMNGSILAFPTMCFLWNVKYPHEVTLESLAPIRLYTPTIQYLFLGCDTPFPSGAISKIKKEMKSRHDIVVESMDVMNAMGTFNILNGEDRRVACAIVLNVDE